MPFRIGIIHPDLGIGGAERLVVDAALGLQKRGHVVDIYTSHHDPNHCFEETSNGTLRVHHIKSPFPRSLFGRFHILFAILSQLHLVFTLLFRAYFSPSQPSNDRRKDVYMVDQLSACIPILRWGINRRVVFYCHFPDKLLSEGLTARVDGKGRNTSFLKWLYRLPADWVEEVTTRQADVILANSKFTAGVFKNAFPSIAAVPRVVYPGINADAYGNPGKAPGDLGGVEQLLEKPILLSLNRYEGKKNLELAIKAFAAFRDGLTDEDKKKGLGDARLVIGGGYDPRLQDNVRTFATLRETCDTLSLPYTIISDVPALSTVSTSPIEKALVAFIPNFSTAQRTALLHAPKTLALLYTPTNEHFGIVPVEGMVARLPVLACESGGPMESVIQYIAPSGAGTTGDGTGWLRKPEVAEWASALHIITRLSPAERTALGERAHLRAKETFGTEAMTDGLEGVLKGALKQGDVSTTDWTSLGLTGIKVAALGAAVAIYLGYL